jgi:hypothetical protein
MDNISLLDEEDQLLKHVVYQAMSRFLQLVAWSILSLKR